MVCIFFYIFLKTLTIYGISSKFLFKSFCEMTKLPSGPLDRPTELVRLDQPVGLGPTDPDARVVVLAS